MEVEALIFNSGFRQIATGVRDEVLCCSRFISNWAPFVSNLISGLVHCRNLWTKNLCKRQVIERSNRDVFWTTQVDFIEGMNETDSHQTVGNEYSRWPEMSKE